MGCYINSPNMSKEDWLNRNAITLAKGPSVEELGGIIPLIPLNKRD